MSEYWTVQSIVRALDVLEALNRADTTTVEMLYEATGIPKPTLVRLLATLICKGYVFHVSRRDGYALTDKVLKLSTGFRYRDAIVDIARPVMESFTRKHKWQVTFATLDNDAMKIRFNTRYISPFAPDHVGINTRVSMLTNTLGRAYLAYSSSSVRNTIIKMLSTSDDPKDAMAKDKASVDSLLRLVRKQRYATMDRPPTDPIRSFAIPVLRADSGDALGAVAMLYFRSAMTEAQAVDRYLEEMYEMGDRIARAAENPA